MLGNHFFKFFIFWPFLAPRAAKIQFFGHRGGQKRPKKWKIWKSDSLTFFGLLFSITGPNFMFLALFYQELNRKMCFWDIAILVKIRDFPWFLTNFGHKTRDKTPTRHFSRHFSLFSGVTHRITWENTSKPVRMTKRWWKFLF